MIVVDLNVLLYAVNRDSPQHGQARTWLTGTLRADETVGLPWVVLLGFLRLSTNPRVFAHPLTEAQALGVVDGWLAQPVVQMLNPGTDHWPILRDLLGATGNAGNLTTDAHLAALAIENGAELVSTDADFGRFARLRWRNPLSP